MRAEGLQIEIPMPGHPCMDAEEELQSTVNRLDQLFREHDVIFLGILSFVSKCALIDHRYRYAREPLVADGIGKCTWKGVFKLTP
jgi:hypothetical protein